MHVPDALTIDLNALDAKLSRKREREASIEPPTPGVRAFALIVLKFHD